MKKLLLLLLAFLTAFSLVACGGGGTNTHTDDVTEPTEKQVYERYPAREIIVEMSKFATADVSFLELTSAVTRVKINGENTDKLYIDDGFLTVSEGILGENLEVTVETETEIVKTLITVVDLAIKTKTDMITFMTNYAGSADCAPYVIMTTDINFGGGVYDFTYPNHIHYFMGTFNGRGHKFYNVKFKTPFIGNARGGLIKNLAIVNAQAIDDFAPFCLRVESSVENIYISCDFTDMTSDETFNQPLCYWVENNGVERFGDMKNVVAVFTGYSKTYETARILRYLEGPVSNIYVIISDYSITNNESDWYCAKQGKGSMSNCGLFSDETAFKSVVNADNAAVTGAFDTSISGCWKFDNNGMLVFKSV